MSVVAWPANGDLPVPRKALAQIAAGFGGAFRAPPDSPLSVVANELVLALAALLIPNASAIDAKAARAEHAVGLATWNVEGARALIEVAVDLVAKASAGGELEIPLERLRFLSPDEDELPEQTLLRNTAERLGAFAHRLDLLDGSKLLVLGSGSRQRRILGLLPDATTFAGHLATNKNVACELLARAGIPVPEGATVTTRAEAHAIAEQLGYPVTLKVATGSRQRGVVPCVVSPRALERALDFFGAGKGRKAIAQELRLERHVPGSYFRCFVAGGEFVACATSPLPQVEGDGKRTIRQLIARQHEWLETVLAKPELAANAERIIRHVLVGHDLAPEDVLERRRSVPIAFATSQGFAHDVTREVHPANRALMVRAARVLGMFWSGIDVQAARIDRPLAEQGGVIIEVNDIPAFAFHGTPLPGQGAGVDMGRAIFRAFWRARRPDVPVVVVAGLATGATASFVRGVSRELGRGGVRVAVDAGARDGALGLEPALDPEVDALVVAAPVEALLERGLGVPAIDVLVLGSAVEPRARKLLEAACRRRKGTHVDGRDPKKAARATVARVLELARA